MPALDDLTLTQVRNDSNLRESLFLERYARLFDGRELDEQAKVKLLSFAIAFLRSADANLNRLGYRILLQHAARFGDYEPLYAVATAKQLMPITVFIEAHAGDDELDISFSSEFLAGFRENFRVQTAGGATYRTRGQMDLRSFAAKTPNSVVVAPTSYGKSEMMIDRVTGLLDRNVCIVVPTKALIAQTKRLLLQSPKVREARVHVITHPDGYRREKKLLAVMTQERLFRLLQLEPDLQFDSILVDEAHNALPDEPRAIQLSQVLMMSTRRNSNLEIGYFTPFIASAGSLKPIRQGKTIPGFTVQETVKVEQFYYTRLESGELFLYDQFLNRSFLHRSDLPKTDLQVVAQLAGEKNILYVNRPARAEQVALDMARQSDIQASAELESFALAIADLLHPKYSLIECVRRGVLFHHGKVPELLRGYIEEIFGRAGPGSPKFLATTSTLLEGVNTPADTMFILNPGNGRGYLTPSNFKNLVGRVGRFREAFDPVREGLDLLQPKIYLLDGKFSREKYNPASYLSRVADVSHALHDTVANPLLEAAEDLTRRSVALEYLDNVDPDLSSESDSRRSQTEVGRLCFQNGVLEFDIFDSENRIQSNLVQFLSNSEAISDVRNVVPSLCKIFFEGVDLNEDDLTRVSEHPEAQRFYSMFLGWRSEGTPYRRMINHFLKYWSKLTTEYVYVGVSYGDQTGGDSGYSKLYVNMSQKSEAEKVNLAVAKVKEEQDFVDFRLMRFVEIMNDLKLLDPDLYLRIKFGTNDLFLIALLKSGLSYELARVISTDYRDDVDVDTELFEVEVRSSLPENMVANAENEILVYEAQCHVPIGA